MNSDCILSTEKEIRLLVPKVIHLVKYFKKNIAKRDTDNDTKHKRVTILLYF